MTKVLITGSNSYVGNNFQKYSRFRYCDEISLFEYEPECIDFSKYNVVLHLVAIVHQSVKIPENEYFRVNKDMCIRTAIAAKAGGIQQFIFLSTVKVYGGSDSEETQRDEDSPCFPGDDYGRSKYEAEIELKKLEDLEFKVSIIRSSLVYGEGVKANMLKLIRLVDLCPILPFRNCNNRRSYVYIENLVGFIDVIIERKASGTFLALDKDSISIRELILVIAGALNKSISLFNIPTSLIKLMTLFIPDTISRLYGSFEFNNSKTLATLNFSIPFSTKEGIIRTVYWYKSKKRLNDKI